MLHGVSKVTNASRCLFAAKSTDKSVLPNKNVKNSRWPCHTRAVNGRAKQKTRKKPPGEAVLGWAAEQGIRLN